MILKQKSSLLTSTLITLILTFLVSSGRADTLVSRDDFVSQLDKNECAIPPRNLYIETNVHRYDLATALSLSWISLTTLGENFISESELGESWGVQNIRYIDNDEHDMTIMLADFQDTTLVTFRHTDSNKNWLYNADYGLWDFDASFTLDEKTHHGFARMLSAEWEELLSEVISRQQSNTKLIVFGHSLGAALAQLSAAGFQAEGINVDQVYLTGSPKVGSREWASKANSLIGDRTYRLVYKEDLIANLPIHYEALDEFREIFSIVPDVIANAFGSVRSLMKFDSLGQRIELDSRQFTHWGISDDAALEEQYWTTLSKDLAAAKQSSWNPLKQIDGMVNQVSARLENHLLRSEDGYFCAMIDRLKSE